VGGTSAWRLRVGSAHSAAQLKRARQWRIISAIGPGGGTANALTCAHGRLRVERPLKLLSGESRPSDADEEVLDVAHDVRSFAGTVKVMTGDTGMRVRATTEGLQVLAIPDAWRRPADKPT
jgi:hypothetical protein